MPEAKPMTARKVHAIKINLQSMAERSVIVWPADTAKLCIQLMNPRRTWLTVQRGDSVTVNGSREFVDSIELYRVFPASENGREVRSAWHWLNPGNDEIVSSCLHFGLKCSAIPCNQVQ